LAAQRDRWAQIFADLNDKIPEGVWITELIPDSNSTAGGGGNQGSQDDLPAGNIDALEIKGLYHDNPKTESVDPSRLRDFVNALADLPLFDIDKNNITTTLPNYGGDTNVFAQQFSMHLKFKTSNSAKPRAGKP